MFVPLTPRSLPVFSTADADPDPDTDPDTEAATPPGALNFVPVLITPSAFATEVLPADAPAVAPPCIVFKSAFGGCAIAPSIVLNVRCFCLFDTSSSNKSSDLFFGLFRCAPIVLGLFSFNGDLPLFPILSGVYHYKSLCI